jgi:hypothetical protein
MIRTVPATGYFSIRDRGHRSLGQSQRGSLVNKAHIGQREIANEEKIFRLLFEERFQFATRLLPAFISHWQEQCG